MRLVITQLDLPHLKQLSYAIAEELNTRLRALKASINDDEALDDLGDDGIDFADHPELKALLEQGLGGPISAHQVSVSEFKELLTQQLPKKIGSTKVQVAIAKAVGYNDWGDLNSKAKHGHTHADSQFEALYGEHCVTEFTEHFLESIDLPEGLIDFGALKTVVMKALESAHSPTSLQFASDKHCLVVGNKSFAEGEVLARRIEFARSAGHRIVVITTDVNNGFMGNLGVNGVVIHQSDILSDFKSLPVDSDVVVVCDHSAMATACKNVLLCTNYDVEEADQRRVHIVIPELSNQVGSPEFIALIAQSRAFRCSIGAGIAMEGVADLTGLKYAVANGYDVVCGPGAPAEIKAVLGADSQPDQVTHNVGVLAGFFRFIKKVR